MLGPGHIPIRVCDLNDGITKTDALGVPSQTREKAEGFLTPAIAAEDRVFGIPSRS